LVNVRYRSWQQECATNIIPITGEQSEANDELEMVRVRVRVRVGVSEAAHGVGGRHKF
jgi:hypothetical protein